LELNGQLTSTTRISANIVSLQLENEKGESTYPWIPRETLKLAISHDFKALGMEAGAALRWQNKVAKKDDNTGFYTRQNAYGVLDMFARWEMTEHLKLSLNLKNISDEKYLTSLYEVGYYSAARTASLGLDLQF
jgi:outer membrane receptor for ferric coprogen and ferric-rhodotorulic acid